MSACVVFHLGLEFELTRMLLRSGERYIGDTPIRASVYERIYVANQKLLKKNARTQSLECASSHSLLCAGIEQKASSVLTVSQPYT